ncbi:hypothetical protein J6590_056253 [Homalodisca vitripennis]|nr:hypothetical protein J6590_056253 [Homalodisca vitripennis]
MKNVTTGVNKSVKRPISDAALERKSGRRQLEETRAPTRVAMDVLKCPNIEESRGSTESRA